MRHKTLFIIGAVLLFGALLAAVAVAQNTDSQSASNHECTQEMMKNMTSNNASGMPENCTSGMAEQGNCDMAGSAMKGCGSMTEEADIVANHAADSNHCSNMGSGMAMMGTGTQKTMA